MDWRVTQGPDYHPRIDLSLGDPDSHPRICESFKGGMITPGLVTTQRPEYYPQIKVLIKDHMITHGPAFHPRTGLSPMDSIIT